MTLLSRWYVIALLASAAVTLALVVLGYGLAVIGNAIGACSMSELGCWPLWMLAVLTAPSEFLLATLFGGIVAHRRTRKGGVSPVTPGQMFGACLGAGVVALFPAYLTTTLYIRWG